MRPGHSSQSTKPRVTISGGDSSRPVCRSSTTTGTTMPSAERWRRSRITISSISSTPGAVEEHAAGGHVGHLARAVAGEGQHVAVFDDEHVVRGHARLHGQARVLGEHAVLAVHGHEVAGAHALDHLDQLVLAGVAGHVHARVAAVHDVAAAAEEVADQARDRALVAGDRARRHHDGVARSHRDVAVLVDADHGQRGERLALAAGHEEAHPAGRIVPHRLGGQPARSRQLEEPELHGHVRVVGHAAADEADGAALAQGDVGGAADAGHGGREAGDEDAAARAREDVLEGGDEVVLGARPSAHLDVRAVREQREHAAVAPGAERVDVGLFVRGVAVGRS